MNKSAIQKRMESLAEQGWHPSLRLMADGTWRVCLMRGSHGTRENIMENGPSPEAALYRAGYEVFKRERRQGPRSDLPLASARDTLEMRGQGSP